jgi:hypothetical protein
MASQAYLDSRQDQAADVCVVPNQLVLGNATVSTQNVCDESNIKVTNAIDFLATPCSPVIGTFSCIVLLIHLWTECSNHCQ